MKHNFYKLKFNVINLVLGLLFFSTGFTAAAQMSLQFADTLEQTLINFANNANMEGVTSAVIFPDGSTWSTAHGNHGSTALSTDMLYDIGSNTKSMVSALILMLEEDGLLSINDTLYQFINVVDNVPYGITLKQLLEQRSGIANYTEHPDFIDSVLFNNQSTFWHPDSLLSRFLEAPLFTAGQYWYYSNTNYVLLGKVIEAIEGQPLNTVLTNRLFSPFNLSNSYLETYDSYSQIKTGAYMSPGNYWGPSSFYAMMSTTWAAGGVVSTPNDFVSWCHQLFRGDILSSTAFTKMKTGTNFGGGNIYGLGIEKIRYNNRSYLMHGGNTMQNSEMHYSLESDFSVAVMNIDQGFYDETKDLQNALIDVLEYAVHHVLSTSNHERMITFRAYPNPSRGTILVDLPNEFMKEKVNFELYNTQGKIVYQGQFSNNQLIIDKADVGEGVFIVKLFNDNTHIGNQRVVFY